MKKTISKRLAVSAITVRTLTGAALAGVAGAGVTVRVCTTSDLCTDTCGLKQCTQPCTLP
jgi:hypothetical protein